MCVLVFINKIMLLPTEINYKLRTKRNYTTVKIPWILWKMQRISAQTTYLVRFLQKLMIYSTHVLLKKNSHQIVLKLRYKLKQPPKIEDAIQIP